jgi:hypothetical protein
MSSLCCNAETHIGYYNADNKPNANVAIGTMGTYCNKCGKLCDYIEDGIEHTTNGKLKPKTKPLTVYVRYDPLIEIPICVHDKPNMRCKICGKREYNKRPAYQLVEKKFIVKSGNKLRKIQ